MHPVYLLLVALLLAVLIDGFFGVIRYWLLRRRG